MDSFNLQGEIKKKGEEWKIALKIEAVEYFDLEKEIEKNNKIFTKMKLDEKAKAKIEEIERLTSFK